MHDIKTKSCANAGPTPVSGVPCEDFMRNSDMVNTVVGQYGFLGYGGSRALMNAMNLCDSSHLKEYVQWRMYENGPGPNIYPNNSMAALMTINDVCKLQAQPIAPPSPSK